MRALRNGCLNKQLDLLCDAVDSKDFNQISVSRAFQVLSGFVKNNPQDEEQIRSSVKQHPHFVRTMMQVAENCMTRYSFNARFSFYRKTFTSLLYGCVHLEITPDEDWQAKFWEVSQKTIGLFNQKEFSNTMQAAAKLGLVIPKGWKKDFWYYSYKKLDCFNAIDLTNTIHAAAKLGLVIPKDWQGKFWEVSRQRFSTFSTQDLSLVLYAAGELVLELPERWQQAFWDHSYQSLGSFNAQDFSNTLYAAARLDLDVPQDWQALFWQYSGPLLGEFNPQALSNTAYAACVLSLKLPDEVKEPLALRLQNHMSDHVMLLQALFNASDYLKAQGIDLIFSQDTFAQLQQHEEHTGTIIQRKTGWALLDVLQKECAFLPNVILEEEHLIEATASSVDFFVKAFGPKGLIIQVDGPFHFLNKGTRRQCVDGFTAFQTRRLEKQGYHVLRLPYDKLETFGVYEIENESTPASDELYAYLKEQLSLYLATVT